MSVARRQIVFNTEAHSCAESKSIVTPDVQGIIRLGMRRENLGQNKNLGLAEDMHALMIEYANSIVHRDRIAARK